MASSQYGVSLKQLRDLMELRGKEAVDKLQEVGGGPGLCKKLRTSETNGRKTFVSRRRRVVVSLPRPQSTNCPDRPSSLFPSFPRLGLSLLFSGGCILNFDLRVFVNRQNWMKNSAEGRTKMVGGRADEMTTERRRGRGREMENLSTTFSLRIPSQPSRAIANHPF